MVAYNDLHDLSKGFVNPLDGTNHYNGSDIVTGNMYIANGTNNIGELMAIIIAINIIINHINAHSQYDQSPIIIATDSKYIIGVLAGGDTPHTNIDLINDIRNRLQVLSNYGWHSITFVWLKGHAGYAGNELADKLAGTAAYHHDDMKHSSHTEGTIIPNVVYSRPNPVANNMHSYSPYVHPSISDFYGICPANRNHNDHTRMIHYTATYLHHMLSARAI
jgi:ribonuclease HI